MILPEGWTGFPSKLGGPRGLPTKELLEEPLLLNMKINTWLLKG